MALQEIYDMTAIGNQVGGTHYTSLKYQPVQLFVDTKCTPFQANIWKYISRYPYKNGKEDIKKCIHYAQLARDLNCMYTGNFMQAKSHVIDYCHANDLSIRQSFVMIYALFNNYEKVEEECLALINQEYQNKGLAKLKNAKFFYIFKEKFLYFKKKFYICIKKKNKMDKLIAKIKNCGYLQLTEEQEQKLEALRVWCVRYPERAVVLNEEGYRLGFWKRKRPSGKIDWEIRIKENLALENKIDEQEERQKEIKKLKERYSRLEEQMAIIHKGSLSVESISRLNEINIEMSNIETKLEKYGEYTIESERNC